MNYCQEKSALAITKSLQKNSLQKGNYRMYIVKNALRCISRSKGRNILIGIIVLVIAISACLGLSIRQAAESAKEETLGTMSVTATISFDRQSMMNSMMGGMGGGGFDRDQFASLMGDASSLSLEEYQKYADAESVQDFYYSLTASMNGTDTFDPVSTESSNDDSSDNESSSSNDPMGGMMGNMMGGMFGSMGDFSIVGYSGESAMTSFLAGTATITDGVVFAEGEANYECIISEELAIYNDLSVGDTITLSNPNAEEVYELTVVGFYTDSSANESSTFMGMFSSTSSDPANQIYMSYATLQEIIEHSESVATTETDENTGYETSTEISGTLAATYEFANTDAYNQFEEDVRTLGLDESYTVSSSDLTAFENSLVPLNTLSSMATTFLVVILIIGAIILVVLNIFNIRERKYEIGVLCAMGMKKGKVAMQFLTEIFAVTLIAVLIGAGVGALGSVPVTNALLENQVASQQSQSAQIESNFGRDDMSSMGDMMGGMMGGSSDMGDLFSQFFGGNSETSYVTEISSAMNFTVVLQMLGIAVLLTLVAGMVSMIFVMRYDPLKILANRD